MRRRSGSKGARHYRPRYKGDVCAFCDKRLIGSRFPVLCDDCVLRVL